MVDRPATTSTLCTVASGQSFLTSLIPTAVGNATKVFDVDSALTDTAISGAYIDEIWFTYTKRVVQKMDAIATQTSTFSATGTTCTITMPVGVLHNLEIGQNKGIFFEGATSDSFETQLTVVDPTSDQIITFPDATGTVALTNTTGYATGSIFTASVSLVIYNSAGVAQKTIVGSAT